MIHTALDLEKDLRMQMSEGLLCVTVTWRGEAYLKSRGVETLVWMGTEVAGRCLRCVYVLAFCVFLCSSVQLGAIFCHLVFFMSKIKIRKCKMHVMLTVYQSCWNKFLFSEEAL